MDGAEQKIARLAAQVENLKRINDLLERLLDLQSNAPIYPQKKKPGRPRKWKGRDGYSLLIAVNSIRAEQDCGVSAAISKLRHKSPLRWRLFTNRELQIRFQEARKFWVPMAKRIAELQELGDKLNAMSPPRGDLFSILAAVTKNPGDF
jgi:hypothetical protein